MNNRTIGFPPNATTILILTIIAAGLQALIIGLDSFQETWVPYIVLIATVVLRMITTLLDKPVKAYSENGTNWLIRVFTDPK